MSQGWRQFRPAIWLAMLGIALVLLVRPPYIGAVFIGAAIGIAIRIVQRRRRTKRGAPGL
jgi:ABC-type Mn2+/Zn2+ transport system permease subunit